MRWRFVTPLLIVFLMLSTALAAWAVVPLPAAAQGPGENLPLAFEAVDLNGGQDLVVARARQIDLAAYPVVPPPPPRQMWHIARTGAQQGRDPHAASKVGDCNSAEWRFLHPFGLDQYDLGEYGYLAHTVAHFYDSFTRRAYAAHNGLTALAVHDPVWAHPATCQPDESPLQCELRVNNAAVAIIMFGTNDMLLLSPQQFDHALRRAVSESIRAGVVPLLSTFPRHLAFPERSVLYNQVVVRVARDFSVPLINLWLALEPLPSHGVAGDQFHLNGPLTRAADLSYPNLETGYPMRNLVTLQALDVLRQSVLIAAYR